MVNSFKSFFVKIGAFSVFIGVGLILWGQYASLRFQSDLMWVLQFFFIATTIGIHLVLVNASKQRPQNFVTYFMAITAIKLFSYLTIILIYALIYRQEALGFVILFLVLYMLYTAFEVVTLLQQFKR